MAEEHEQPGTASAEAPNDAVAPGAAIRADAIETAEPAGGVPASSRARTVRGIFTWVLIVLACVVTAVSAIGIWANQVLFDTSRFVSIVEPISRDPAVDAAISTATSEQLVRALRIQERAEEVLPSRAGFLSFTLQAAAQRVIEEQLQQLISREGFQSAWLTAIGFAHEQIVAILRDEVPTIVSQDGVIYLNLFPLIQSALERLNATGLLPERFSLPTLSTTSPDEARQELSSALGVQLPDTFGVIPVAETPQLEQAQSIVSTFDTLVVVVPIIALLLVGGAIALSLNRRRTVVALGVGIGALLILLGLVSNLLGQEAVKAVQDRPAGVPIVQASVDALTDNLWRFLRPAIAVSLIVAGIAFLVGRRTWFEAAGATARPAGRWLLSSGRWIAEYDDALRIAGVVLAIAALIVVDLSWGTLLLILLLFVAYMVAVSLLASRWRTTEQSPSAL